MQFSSSNVNKLVLEKESNKSSEIDRTVSQSYGFVVVHARCRSELRARLKSFQLLFCKAVFPQTNPVRIGIQLYLVWTIGA